MRRALVAIVCAVLAATGLTPGAAHADIAVTVVNSDVNGAQVSRFDVDGNALDAHDGSIVQVGDLYYLYGTSYSCGYRYTQNSSFCGYKVYSSPDLVHWTDRGYVVEPGQCAYCFRPHVVYNASTSTYVLWADMGLGNSYGVFTSPSPTGLFTRRANPTLAIGQSVDMALFVDSDGTGYVIHNTTLVPSGMTADMVVEKLTPNYLTTTGEAVRLGLGNVEAFAPFKRDGVYHVLMSDPTCAYCAGATGEVTATSMLGPWSGVWYDPNGWNIYENRPQPRNRARIVNADNCGGQPLAVLPVNRTGGTDYYFVSDRWGAYRDPNQGLANFFLGPLAFDAQGTLQTVQCVNSFTATLPGSTVGAYTVTADQDQHSGFDRFRHHCDIAGNVWRQQTFTPSRTGVLTSASMTTFQRNQPTAPLIVDVVDAATGTLLHSTAIPAGAVPWTPTVLAAHPNVAVTAGHTYTIRLRSSTTAGCYGFEYNDFDPYQGGVESYSVNRGGSFTAESSRDLKFTTDVNAAPAAVAEELPAGYTRCAGEGGTCAFTGTRVVAYGAGGYRFKTVTGGTACGIAAFGGDPVYGVLKSCYVAPAGGPAGHSQCAAEGGNCAFTGPKLVAYGANGAFVFRLATNGTACTSAAFGRDPISGQTKACYTTTAAAPAGNWQQCAAEGGTCTVNGPQTVFYGTSGAYYARQINGSVTCSATNFGGAPIAGATNACYTQTGGPVGFGTACAGESGTCSFSGFRTVAYGAAGRYVYKSFTDAAPCNPSSFGLDPIFGVVKSCYLTT
ncbi:family 43 glycosylhydrolase [Actinoplanes sp. NPDC051346]|uniref:family 43 glycosylhydrolase n=1 Tax=Actinoplanes sp. NPDC051346 TaxID=3155048 RepID=UPI003432B3DB